MAYFEEMLIQGVRSYPPDKQSVIKFVHPITIIQGANGAGKTTIIESLANICTGALPSGQKQAFLHSLERTKSQRVDALIKLRFKDKFGREVIAATRMTGTPGKDGVKLTTVRDESTIKIVGTDDERGIAISSKAGDFQREMLNLLGIPKAILENVIFCHQEESTWPLSTPKVLKEKFDDIFSLTQYVKFIERIRKLMKDYKCRCDVANATCDGASALHREKVQADRRKRELDNELDEAEEKKKRLRERHEKAAATQREASERLQTIQDVNHKKNIAITKKSGFMKHRDMIDVPEWTGTEEELREMIRGLESSSEYRSAEQEKKRLENRLVEVGREMGLRQGEKRRLEGELSTRQAQQIHHDNTTAILQTSIEDAAKEYGLRVDVNMAKQLQAMQDEIQGGGERKMRRISTELDKLRDASETAKMQQMQRSVENDKDKELRRQTKEEAEILRQRLNKLHDSQNDIPEKKSEMARLEEQLKRATKGEGDDKNDIERKKKLSQEITQLREDSKNSAKWEEIAKQREQWQKEENEASKARTSLIEKHSHDMKTVFGKQLMGVISSKVDEMLTQCNPTLKDHREETRQLELAADRAATIVRTKKTEIDAAVNEQRELREKIRQCTHNDEMEPEDVEWRHDQTLATVDNCRRELSPLEASALLYDKWAEETRKKGCCPMCDRSFPDKKGVAKLVEKLSNLSMSIPNETVQLAEKLKQEEEEERQLAKAMNYVEQLRTAAKKENDLKKELKEDEEEEKKQKSQAEEWRQRRTAMENMIEAAMRIKSDASLMDKYLATEQRLGGLLEEGESVWESEGRRAVSETAGLRKKLETKEKELESLNVLLDERQKAAAEVNRLTKEINAIRHLLLTLDEDLLKQDDLRANLEAKHDIIGKIDKRLSDYGRVAPVLEREVEEARGRCQQKDQELQKAKSETQGAVSRISDQCKRVMELESELGRLQQGPSVEEYRERVRVMDSTVEELRQRKAHYEHEVSRVGEAQTKKRTLDDQLMLITVKRELEKLQKEIDCYGNLDEEENRWTTKMKQSEDDRSSITREIGEVEGSVKAFESEMKTIIHRLSQADMRGSEKKYVDAMSRRVVLEHTLSDLDRYCKELEKSMLDFHKEKMAAINGILDDLWREVYRGEDIDSIRIQSDSMMESDSKRRAYNYHVMMRYNNGEEVLMRDRCSAGQKMLACLLIRLALADVFGSRCATIALDEPTTNLDMDKVENMADMISNLVHARSSKSTMETGGKGLQMIIITHDKRLVERIRLSCRPEYVYVVGRDAVTTLSQITRVYNDGHTSNAGLSRELQLDKQLEESEEEKKKKGTGTRKRGTQ